jgi:hypothetical protein
VNGNATQRVSERTSRVCCKAVQSIEKEKQIDALKAELKDQRALI